VSDQQRPEPHILTNTYALHYAATVGQGKNGRPAVVEIDTDSLDPRLLNADEDALEQTQRRTDGLPMEWTPKQRVLHYRREIAKRQYDWQASLDVLGTCSYGGPIPLSAVTKIALIDRRKQKWLIFAPLDAVVTVANHRFAGKRHKAALLWAMEADELPEDIRPFDFGEEHKDPRIRYEFVWPPSESRDGIEYLFAGDRNV
jgi:hypothetical protein